MIEILRACTEQSAHALDSAVSPTAASTQSKGALTELFSRIGGIAINDRESWITECLRIGEAQYATFNLGAIESASDVDHVGWLACLTAFQAAKLLLLPNDPRQVEFAVKIQACTQRCLLDADFQGEKVEVPCFDGKTFSAYFLPARVIGKVAPAVICICDEPDALLSQALPAIIRRGMSLLIVGMAQLQASSPSNSTTSEITPEMRFACCIDYLLSRHDVDAECIAAYGHGFAAESATRFTIFDSRVAAAVCDGGLWYSVRTQGVIDWLAGPEEHVSNETLSLRRSRLALKIKCPFLVVADEDGGGCISEAIALQAESKQFGVRMDLHVPEAIQTPAGAVQDPIATNRFIFDWLEFELGTVRRSC